MLSWVFLRIGEPQRRANCLRRPTIAEPGSANGAIAVKWLAPVITPNCVARPALPQHSTTLWLCRKYSALSFSPTTASRLPRDGAAHDSGLAARADSLSRRRALLMLVLTSGTRSNRPEMA